MSQLWYYGRANRRSVKFLDDGTALVQFSTTRRPIGSRIDPPDELGSTTVEHEEPETMLLSVWTASGERGDGVQIEDVTSFADGKPDPQQRGKSLGHCELVGERAVRKNADGKGGEVTEHRFTLRVPLDGRSAFDTTPLGYLLSTRAHALGLMPSQGELAGMPPRRRKGKKDGSAQLDLAKAGEGKTPPDDDEPSPGSKRSKSRASHAEA